MASCDVAVDAGENKEYLGWHVGGLLVFLVAHVIKNMSADLGVRHLLNPVYLHLRLHVIIKTNGEAR